MISKEIENAIRAAPFRPFRIHFGSGRSVLVRHPEFIHLSPSGRTAIVWTEIGSFEEGDRSQIVDVLLIESIEFTDPRNQANGVNGSNGASAGPADKP